MLPALPTKTPHPPAVHSKKQPNSQVKSIPMVSRKKQKEPEPSIEPTIDDEDGSEDGGGSWFEEEIASDDSDRDGNYQEPETQEDEDREARGRKQVTKQMQALLQSRNLATISLPQREVSNPLIT